MSPRVYVRKFDWDEARARREAGESYAAIARALGVSATAIRFACDPGEYARARRGNALFQRSGVCVDCGGACSRNCSRPVSRCGRCAALALVTSVRPDALQCVGCREWKPDDAFPSNRAEPHRRNRHGQCRACQTRNKRAYRERTRVPCSTGCGRMVNTADRADKTKPLFCHPCAMRRVSERYAQVAA